ncbi:saccharopine dehydrogenase-like oxidoreductase [Melitaea cinxia]|uniref:saccharopine dehydrogenase-like oxidoreductase n=1 Tax=Melitaea cinxia TaxID=113334 RepID=UPI001E272363|nr:saccharopine dehydrogenase-like oxidoreductase [Melitaea cinxia]
MSRLDLIIFGATGYTGKNAVKELCRVLKNNAFTGLTWGVAGRSESKLDDVLREVSKKTEEDLSSIRKVIADVSDEKSLTDMCLQCKVIVNCCGPYRNYGEPVVKAAIEAKTHYVDVSGEPEFMETMQLFYNERAREAGVYIISACGFDSIPNDMGVIFLQQNFGGTVNSVESYLTVMAPKNPSGGYINYGTWETLVYSLANYSMLSKLRKKLYPTPMPDFKPKLTRRRLLHSHNSAYTLPFPGSDGAVVYRTQRSLYEHESQRPAQFKAYVTFPSLFMGLKTLFGAIVLYLMSMLSCTRALLLRYPRLFSGGTVSRTEPSETDVQETRFYFELLAEGWAGDDADLTSPPNKTMTAKVTGSNPGYGATVVALLFSAIMILREQDKMPKCGVLTPGYAYRKTSIIQHLNENNLKFEIVSRDSEKQNEK